MCEVTRTSFEKLFPLIEKTIKQADFVAIDSEFTGLYVRDNDKPSLFDTSEERYKKMRNSVTRLTLCQIGISAFVKNKTDSVYEAHTFNFPLCSMAFGPIDPGFTWQASALEFLSRFSFDFNKCVYEGVSFLNDEQERQLCQSMESGALFSGVERQFDESFIQSLCSVVAQWYVSSKEGETYTLHKTQADAKLWCDYVIHSEIRRRFPLVWTVNDTFKNIAVEKVTAERRTELEERNKVDQEQEQEKLKQSMLGFTRVFRVLREYQKILVGHNMMMDLMFMYDKFFRPLPPKYATFKRDLHTVFPRIYDTKQMSFSMKKMLEDITGVFSTNLVQLHRILNSDKVVNSVLYTPSVSHATGLERYKDNDAPHEAGFDAYLCGFAFLRMCHLLHFRNTTKNSMKHAPFRLYLESLAPQVNKVNMIRAMLNHIQLDGRDPPCLRPQQLYVRCRKRGQKLNSHQLAERLSVCGTVDIRLLSSSTALVVAGNFTCARAIMAKFNGHRVLSVSKYRYWRHSGVAKTVMWCGFLLSSGVCVWTVLSLFKDGD
ncbi:poly(A)-specific ribonuclease PNLDC1-like [Littorina saxatilis]|uniref:Uncharacterized protein n=1 Tax=Littorina saxatilis TaxID=31220 RepID=A0AAN9FVL6_9CAEN